MVIEVGHSLWVIVVSRTTIEGGYNFEHKTFPRGAGDSHFLPPLPGDIVVLFPIQRFRTAPMSWCLSDNEVRATYKGVAKVESAGCVL